MSSDLQSSVSKQKRAAFVLMAVALLLLLLPFYFPVNAPVLLLLVGRFHPVVLHFPIVLIVLCLVLEVMRRARILRNADNLIAAVLIAASLSALMAIFSGFLLFASGEYSGALVEQHLWIGVATGTFIFSSAAAYFVFRIKKKFYTVYMTALIMSNAGVAFASHLGGSVTHGEGYLTEYLSLLTARGEKEQPRSDTQMLMHEDVLMPVFETKCNGCHNDARSKGQFVMTSLDAIKKGGESGRPGILSGNADSSELYARVVLPEGHPDRMPPEGKTPLTENEVLLLKTWIITGAKPEISVKDVLLTDSTKAAFSAVQPELVRYRRKLRIAEIKGEAMNRELMKVAVELNIDIAPDSNADEGRYMVAMKFPPAAFSTRQLKKLVGYADVFSKLSLVSSGVDDEGLYTIGKMRNLKTLYLQKSRISGEGLVHLQKLEQLEVLNLSYTDVGDRYVLDLLKIPSLKEVYLFQTKATPQVISALQQYRPELQVKVEEGPYK